MTRQRFVAFVFQSGPQIMVVQLIGNRCQSCCRPTQGPTLPHNDCLESGGEGTEQDILLCQFPLKLVTWPQETRAQRSSWLQTARADGPGETRCSSTKISQVRAPTYSSQFLPCTSNYIKSTKSQEFPNCPFFLIWDGFPSKG